MCIGLTVTDWCANRFCYLSLQVTESQRATDTGQPYPLHASKTDTNTAYNAAVRQVLHRIAEDERAAALLVATHNTASVTAAVETMKSLNIAPSCPHVQFAQVKGMSDHLAAALSRAGYNANKLVLFGDFADLFPWLLRRLDENRDMLGAAQVDRGILLREIRRRLFG